MERKTKQNMKINDTIKFIEELTIPILSISQSSLEELLQIWELEDSPTGHRDYVLGDYAYSDDEEWEETRSTLGLPLDCEKPTCKFIVLTRG